MPLSIGLVGLPNAGKSTLFNALLKKQFARVENRPFTTINPSIGIVDVPDERLEKLAKAVQTTTIIPATLKIVDIAGLVKDAHKGVGLGNQFLAHIQEVDLIVYVVRAFEDPQITHVSPKVDPKEDLEILKLELELADIDKKTNLSSRAQRETPSDRDLSPFRIETHRLSDKPTIAVINVSENQLKNHDQTFDHLEITTEGKDMLPICAKTEAELVELPEDEQKEYLESLGLHTFGLDRLLRLAYQKLGLITFFTAGEKEARAWTVKNGASAPEAAAKIHTDMQRGFIAVDVIPWDTLVQAPGWKQAKEKGWVRLEGKDYLVKDGDVLIVRFNV